MNSEIGEELLAEQLVPKTVYVLEGTHRPGTAFTMWYVRGVDGYAEFYSGVIEGAGHVLHLRVSDKGQFFDDMNHRIAVHKYLGEV